MNSENNDLHPRFLLAASAPWKQLALTDLAFKLIAFIILTPLLGTLFRLLIAASGRSVLSDLDILYFFLGPIGWICIILVGALWLTIVALEQAALMGIVAAASEDRQLGVVSALRLAAAHAWPVIRVTIRMLAISLLLIVPFLIAAGAVYFALLTEHDINYYLQEKPREFRIALGCGVLLGVTLVATLLRLYTGWFFALPLVLFEKTPPSAALRLSQERTRGHRRRVLLWIVAWLLLTTAISAIATGLVGLMGSLLVPDATKSLRLLVVAIGFVVLAGSLVNLALNLLSTTSIAVILFHLYRRLGSGDDFAIANLNVSERETRSLQIKITEKRLAITGIIGGIAAVAIGVGVLESIPLEDRVDIAAHRGSSLAAPENTMAAIRRAIEDGADWVEIDVQETADGEVVVFHDSDFMKVAGLNLKIWNATTNELKDIDIGSWFAPEFKSERVPTLTQVLDECKGQIGVIIELKYYGHDEQLEQRVVDIVEETDMVSEVMVMSLKADAVTKMRALRPQWRTGLLMTVAAGNLGKIDADFLAVNASTANWTLISTAHGNEKGVFVWTVNDAPTMSTMIGRGVDGLLTDRPDLARSVLEQRAEMNAAERLLLELAGVLGAESEFGEQ